jgi:hypothetical protein
VSIDTNVRSTSETLMSDPEVQHQKHRTRQIREVTTQLYVPTLLTPTSNHLTLLFIMKRESESKVENLFISVGVMKD